MGSLQIHGAKNAVLPMLAAGLLTEDGVSVSDCPHISDIDAMLALVGELGAKAERKGRNVIVYGRATRTCVSGQLASVMRSSMFMLGALLASLGEVKMPLPGGCDIGARPLDIHLDGLRKMGAICEFEDGELRCYAKALHGADIVMRYPSVGATENLLMCASLATGRTTLVNCAREPEIISLARCLRAMGANITGEGTSVMTVEGVRKLHGASASPCADRIVAGTVMAAVALAGGDVSMYGISPNLLSSVTDVFQAAGASVTCDSACMRVRSDADLRALSVSTAPFPLFPTDMQPQLMACLCYAKGVSFVRETVFENRFAHAEELSRLGARVVTGGDVACISSPEPLHPAVMSAKDLRGGAALVISALGIDGESEILNPHFIDRGYEDLPKLLRSLGADVTRQI